MRPDLPGTENSAIIESRQYRPPGFFYAARTVRISYKTPQIIVHALPWTYP
jgi:hypothetical protein